MATVTTAIHNNLFERFYILQGETANHFFPSRMILSKEDNKEIHKRINQKELEPILAR